MNLILVRHGEISSNVMKVYAGRSSEELNERGIKQAHEVADKIDAYNVNSLYSSPVIRAVQTAQIISNKIGKDNIIEENFREIEMGPWEGLSEEKITELYPLEWGIWQKFPVSLNLPGRETLNELLHRVLTGVSKIHDNNIDQTVVVVTHVAIIRVLLLWHAQRSLNLYKQVYVPNAEIFEVNIETNDRL